MDPQVTKLAYKFVVAVLLLTIIGQLLLMTLYFG
jgi:hypothetical protein